MKSEGYGVRWESSRANITYTIPSGYKCRDDRLHDERYLKGAMEREFRIREKIIHGGIETAESAAFFTTRAEYAEGSTGVNDTGSDRDHSAIDGDARAGSCRSASDAGGVVGAADGPCLTGSPHGGAGSPCAELSQQASTHPTREQIAALARDAAAIRSLLEQAGKKNEQRFSLRLPRLPHPHLPRPSSALLLIPVIALVFWAAWSSWGTLWSAIRMLLP